MILSIIIPSKNEEKYINGVLDSISNSNLCKKDYEIIVSDSSNDDTKKIVKEYDGVKLVEGGPTPIARNNGVKISNGKYILFIDSDITFKDKNLINKVIYNLRNYDMVTTNLRCETDGLVNFIYRFNNLTQKISILDGNPFSTGAFMGVKKEVFNELGGFDPEMKHCEDYMLSKQIDSKKFKIISSEVYSDNRRFKKMGYWGMVKYFFNNIINRNNEDHFKKDAGYW